MKQVLGIAVLLVGWLLTSGADAGEPTSAVDSERFRPATARDGGVLLEGAAIGLPWEVDGTLWLHGSGRPVVLTHDGVAGDAVVSGRFGGYLQAGFNIGRRVRLAVGLPVTLYQQGIDPVTSVALATGGVGDFRVTPQVMILDPSRQWLGVSLSAPITFPTGREDALLGESGPTVHPRVHVEKRLVFIEKHRWLRFGVALEAGWRVRPRTKLLDLDTGGEFTVALGGRWEPSDRLAVGTELVAALGEGTNARSAEWVSWTRLTPDRSRRFDVVGGVAVGLGRGVGTPQARIFGGVRVRLDPRPRRAVVEGYGSDDLAAPPDLTDPGPQPPIPGDSSTSWGLRLVRRTARIDSHVLFDFDSARLTEGGRGLLRDVAGWLQRHPRSGAIEVGGHCDSTGDSEYNRVLSQRRAEAVVDALVGHGVPRERLTAKGYGEGRPVLKPGQASSQEVDAANRRVELVFTGEPVRARVSAREDATTRRR